MHSPFFGLSHVRPILYVILILSVCYASQDFASLKQNFACFYLYHITRMKPTCKLRSSPKWHSVSNARTRRRNRSSKSECIEEILNLFCDGCYQMKSDTFLDTYHRIHILFLVSGPESLSARRNGIFNRTVTHSQRKTTTSLYFHLPSIHLVFYHNISINAIT